MQILNVELLSVYEKYHVSHAYSYMLIVWLKTLWLTVGLVHGVA